MAKTNQLITIKSPHFFALPKLKVVDLFDLGLFVYFFTLHADQLSLSVGGMTFRLNNVIAFFLASVLLIRLKRFSVNKPFFLSLMGIALSLVLSTLFSPFPKRCLFFLGWYGFTIFGYVLFPYLLVKKLNEEKIFRFYFSSFVCVGLYALLQGLLSLIGVLDPFANQLWGERGVRPNAFAYEPSFYALYMTPFIMMVNFHYLSQKDLPLFCFSLMNRKKLLFLNFLYLLSTSTSTLFAYIFFGGIVVGYAVLKRNQRLLKNALRLGFFCLSASGLACVFIPHVMRQFFLKFFYYGFMAHHSFYERWWGICNGWEIFKRHCLVGVGLGALPNYLYEAWSNKDSSFTFPFGNAFYQMEVPNPLKYFEPSSIIMELIASLGLFGMIFFGIFLFVFFKRLAKSQSLYAAHFAIGVVVMLMILQFNQGLFRTYVWTHFALVFAYVEKKQLQTKQSSLEDLDPATLP